MDYQKFISGKRIPDSMFGFEPNTANKHAFPWQQKIVDWAVRRGRSALFAGTGLGKTLMQLCWAENIAKHAGPVLVLCPLGVRLQTKLEADRFGIGVESKVVSCQEDCISGINITNYDKLEHFDTDLFSGVILGESSILKSMTGKTRTSLIERFKNHRYRLAETATPAPNDHMELGNHAEFLSVMQSVDMLNRFFYHDSSDTSNWLLMPHGERHFWSWVASWAVCISMPSDIGGDDTGYILPPLNIHRHFVEVDNPETLPGFLFSTSRCSATTIFEEKRMTATDRVNEAVKHVPKNKPCVVWCDTNHEADLLGERMPDAVEIRGNDKTETKEERLQAFANGQIKTLISKPSICGHGLNWQHCDTMVFSGLTYSFEQYYQAIRRCWRFGQKNPVDVHVVLAETDSALSATISRKESDFDAMRAGMAEAMRTETMLQFGIDSHKKVYQPSEGLKVPSWLK